MLRRVFGKTEGKLYFLGFLGRHWGSYFRALDFLFPTLGMEFYGLGVLYVAGNSFADEEALEKGFGGFVERESLFRE